MIAEDLKSIGFRLPGVQVGAKLVPHPVFTDGLDGQLVAAHALPPMSDQREGRA